MALTEQEPDFRSVLELARSLREQVDWGFVRRRTAARPSQPPSSRSSSRSASRLPRVGRRLCPAVRLEAVAEPWFARRTVGEALTPCPTAQQRPGSESTTLAGPALPARLRPDASGSSRAGNGACRSSSLRGSVGLQGSLPGRERLETEAGEGLEPSTYGLEADALPTELRPRIGDSSGKPAQPGGFAAFRRWCCPSAQNR